MLEIRRFAFKTLVERLNEPQMSFLQVLIGPRQTGKSTLIQQVAATWEGSKEIASADGVAGRGPDWIEFLWQKSLDKGEKTLLAIDEIQKVDGWSETLKVLFDKNRHHKNLRVVISGSASLSLQTGLSESLAGRYEIIHCPHWGLDESQLAFNWDLNTQLKYGGYPAPAILIKDNERWCTYIRDSIIEPVLGRDLQRIVQIQKPALLRQLFSLAMRYPAQEISYQKLLGQLQDHGNTATIRHYLDILKGGFLLETLEKYSGSVVRQKGSSPKLIPMAPALIHAFTDPETVDINPEWRGRVFESAIGAHLVRTGCELFYWREGDREVDFVAILGGDVVGIEVKSGRRKRADGLIEFKKRFPDAKVIFLDWEKGRRFLLASPSKKSLLESAE